jgi:hypothetical protein
VWLLVALQVLGFLLLLGLVVLATVRAWEAGLHGLAAGRLQVLQVGATQPGNCLVHELL